MPVLKCANVHFDQAGTIRIEQTAPGLVLNVSSHLNVAGINVAGTLYGLDAPGILTKIKTVDGEGSGLDADTVQGLRPDQVCPTGAVFHFAANAAPIGFLKCNGALISRTTYSRLFSVIGTTWGTGDGSTTFALPDLRGEFLRGWDDGRGIDTGRTFGSWQDSTAFGFYAYRSQYLQSRNVDATVAAGVNVDRGSASYTSVAQSFLHTRPRNVALLACIKY